MVFNRTQNSYTDLAIIVIAVVAIWYLTRNEQNNNNNNIIKPADDVPNHVQEFLTRWDNLPVGCPRTAPVSGIYLIQDKQRRWFNGPAWTTYRILHPTAPPWGNRLTDEECLVLAELPRGPDITSDDLLVEDFVTRFNLVPVNCPSGIYLIQDKQRRWFDGPSWSAYRTSHPNVPQWGVQLKERDCEILAAVPKGPNMGT